MKTTKQLTKQEYRIVLNAYIMHHNKKEQIPELVSKLYELAGEKA